jgi:hypothetical protein
MVTGGPIVELLELLERSIETLGTSLELLEYLGEHLGGLLEVLSSLAWECLGEDVSFRTAADYRGGCGELLRGTDLGPEKQSIRQCKRTLRGLHL